MTDILCGYIDRDETIVAFLYDDLDAARRRDFNAHLLTCAVCREEVAGLRRVRTQLSRWAPPEPGIVASVAAPPNLQSVVEPPHWWRTIPAWAQVAAALLFLGISAGIANLEVRYDQNGLSVRTGWSQTNRSGVPTDVSVEAPGATAAAGNAKVGVATNVAATDAPWRTDLAALERQLKAEFHASQVPAPAAQAVRLASSSDAETLRRVRALLDESEKRQQREIALRIAEVVRDVNAQRQVDLRNIDRTLGIVSNDLGVEVMKQRQSLNLLYRASQRQ
jgi:anti-sigma factor RsiW